MTGLIRRTPCIGICSTTYGDLVCRGCKRFSHEIVQWNRFEPAQRQQIEQRLATLKNGAVERFLRIVDRRACQRHLGLPPDFEGLELRLYEHLLEHRTAVARLPLRLAPGINTVAALQEAVEAEFLARSRAAYEHSFKVVLE